MTQRASCSIKPYLLNTVNYLQHYYDNDIVKLRLQAAKMPTVLCGSKNKMNHLFSHFIGI